MNNNKSRADISLQESWASNLSNYILLRRQQTQVAYNTIDDNSDTDDGSAKIDKTEDSGLFSALFVMLATHLEEGHTVLTIESAANETPRQGHINGELVTLHVWQQQLLEVLAMPILALIDTQVDSQSEDDATPETSLFVLLETLFNKQSQLWAQLTLSNHEKEVLDKRFDMVTTLYQLLKNSDFESFVQSLHKHTLFADVDTNTQCNTNKNSLSKSNKPIVYQLINNQEADKRNTLIDHFLVASSLASRVQLSKKYQ